MDETQANDMPSAKWAILWSTAIGVLVFVGGYLLVVSEEHEAYGFVMFLLLPAVVGFAIGAVGRRGLYVLTAIVLTLIFSLGLLMIVGWEGWICCLMALPLLVVPMAIGAVIGYFAIGRNLDRRYDAARTTVLLLIVSPLLMAAAGKAEQPWRNVQAVETITTEVHVAAPPMETWEQLVRMPNMEGNKPFLLQIGLPVPYRCTLDRDGAGGQRTCYFDQGRIEMEVTEWQPPKSIAMRIKKSTLPGRRWLTFIDASYELIDDGAGTRVVRHSTIGSKLYPRWYWRPLESWGVVSEHEFVLSSLPNSTVK